MTEYHLMMTGASSYNGWSKHRGQDQRHMSPEGTPKHQLMMTGAMSEYHLMMTGAESRKSAGEC
jgi:hypothetical protein